MTRLSKIVYAGLVLGKDQTDPSYTLTAPYTFTHDYRAAEVAFDVVVANATRATFLASAATLVATFRKINEDLEVFLGATTRHAFKRADGTGFMSRASCRKVGGAEDTANSARYACRVAVSLPADEAAQDGLRDARLSLEADVAGQLTATYAGEFTLLPGDASALARYMAEAEAKLDAKLAAYFPAAEWDPLLPPGPLGVPGRVTVDERDNVAAFALVYREVRYPESAAATSVEALTDPQLTVEVVTPRRAGAVGFGAAGVQRLRATYQADVRWDAGLTPEEAYATYARTLVANELATLADGPVRVTEERLVPTPTKSRILVVTEAEVDSLSGVLTADLIVSDAWTTGLVHYPVFDGTPYARDEYAGPARHRKRVTRVTVARPGRIAERQGIPAFPGFREVSGSREERRYEERDVTTGRVLREGLVLTVEYERVELRKGGATGALAVPDRGRLGLGR